jgi:cytoskeleton protein RodZ
LRQSLEQGDQEATTFGERLRRAREIRAISLEEIAAATKISTRQLRALEQERFDLLPGGIFNKGYLRAYANYIGIDEASAIADYLRAVHESPPDPPAGKVDSASSARQKIRPPIKGPRWTALPVIPLLVLVMVILGAAGGWRLYRERRADNRSSRLNVAGPRSSGNTASAVPASVPASIHAASPSSAAPSSQSAAGAPGAPLPDTSAARASRQNQPPAVMPANQTAAQPTSPELPASKNSSGSAVGAPFAVTVRAKNHAWVSIKSDGKLLLRGLMKPFDVRTIYANHQVIFWTGDAGEVELSFNGKDVPLDGGPGNEQILIFNSRGVLPRPAAQ